MEKYASITSPAQVGVDQPLPEDTLPHPPKPHSPSPRMWIGVGLLLVVFGGGYYLLISRKPSVTQPPKSTPIASVLTSPTTDPTANWKTYMSEKFSFQFKYPPEWELWSVDGSMDFSPNTPMLSPNRGTDLLFGYIERNTDKSTSKQMQLYVKVLENPSHLTIKDYFKKAGWSDDYINNMEETTVNNLNAIEMILPWNETLSHFIALDKYIIRFDFSYIETTSKFPFPPKTRFKEILSTFRFVD